MVAEHFHGIEVLNGEISSDASKYVETMAERYGKFATGGSDSHSVEAIARCATLFENVVTTDDEMVAEMRAGRVSAVRLAPPNSGMERDKR